MQHCLPEDKILCERYREQGFYFVTVGKKHGRLIEIAVHRDHKGKGLGKKLLYRLLTNLKRRGISKLTFRTPIDEDAQGFWIHNGAKIVGLKDNDYEMELNFK